MTYFERMTRHYAKLAMVERLAELGLPEDRIPSQNEERVFEELLHNTKRYHIDMKTYMRATIKMFHGKLFVRYGGADVHQA